MGKDKTSRKRKAAPATAPAAPATAPAAPAGGFSLFSAPKDADLGDIFSASAALALPKEGVKRARVEKKEKEVEEEEEEEVEDDEGQEVEEEEEVEDDEEEDEVEEDDDHEADEESDEAAPSGSPEADPAEVEPASDAESDISLTHESLKPSKKKGKKVVYVPPGETREERDRRTVFVGNVGIDVAKNKSAQNQLRAHILTFAPSARIESVRCRSVAFATPTAALPGEDEDDKAANKRAKREKERAAQWRAAQEGSTTGGAATRRGDDEVVDKSKSFLDSKGKRKVAFIKGEFHSDAASCNAYVVFGYCPPDRPANVAPIMDPFEAAEKALAADGSVFQGRTIRVDRLRLPSAVALEKATNALGKRDAWLPAGTDPKQSLFVGGLDYAAKDEDVRAFFEALVVAERGQPENGHWVTGVRIVRDRDTQLGKGFGYVHFVDRESVDEMIALPSAKLKFAKKPLRVQPARTLPAYVKVHAKPEEKKDGKAKGKARAPAGPIPRGNPALGEKLKDLSKEERKAVKSTDADRLARRMAKKRNKVAAAHRETGAVKLSATKAEKKRTEKKVKAKKGRVRSAHALSKAKGSRA